MGELRKIHWSWESKDSDVRVGYLSMNGRVSLAEMIQHMNTVAPGVDFVDIEVNWGTVTWTRPATEEELAQRRAHDERQRARREEWERKTYALLAEKYGEQPPVDESKGEGVS